MLKTRLSIVVQMVCCATVLAAGTAFAQECQLKLFRPDKTGQKTLHEFTLEKTVTRSKYLSGRPQETLPNQPVPVKLAIAAQFTRQVIEAGNSDNPLRLLVTFHKFTVSKNGESAKEVLPKGTQLKVSVFPGDPLTFEPVSSSVKIEDDTRVMLGMVMQPQDASDDECYGSKIKRKPGDTWPVNDVALSKRLHGGADSSSLPESVDGKVSFVKLEKVDGADCAVLSVALSATYKPGEEGSATDIKVLGSKLVGTGQMVVPVDANSPAMGRTSDQTSTSVSQLLAPGETVESKLQIRTVRNETVKVVK
jgi:hypothetical protein